MTEQELGVYEARAQEAQALRLAEHGSLDTGALSTWDQDLLTLIAEVRRLQLDLQQQDEPRCAECGGLLHCHSIACGI